MSLKSYSIGNYQRVNRLKQFNHKGLGIITYDKDNQYPQRMGQLIGMSGTATIATKRESQHIIGNGFTDEAFNGRVINRYGLKMHGLLRKIARSFSQNQGFGLQFNYNIFGQWVEVNFVPFKDMRLAIPDDFGMINKVHVYDNWANEKEGRIFKDKIKKYNVFNPDPGVVLSQMEVAGGVNNYIGQILYYGEDGVLKYPLSEFDPVRDELETDGNIQIFKNSNVRNKFQAGHILTTKKFDDDTARKNFQDNVRAVTGPESASSTMHFEVEDWHDKDEPSLKIDKIEQQMNDTTYQWHEQSVQNGIRKAKSIPPVMMGDYPVGGLGNIQEYENSFRVMNQITKDDRLAITQMMETIFKFNAFGGNPSGDYTIDPLILDDNGIDNTNGDQGTGGPPDEPGPEQEA